MTSVDRSSIHRADFHLLQISMWVSPLEDLLGESSDLYHDFVGFQVVLSFCCLIFMFFKNPFSCLSLSKSVFLVVKFTGLLGSSIEFMSFCLLFTLLFHFIVHVHYTHELYQRVAYL